MPLSHGIDNLHSRGFIKAFEQQRFGNDSDLARLRVDNRPAAIFVASGVILRAYSNYHLGLCFSVS